MAWGGECMVYPIVPDKPDMIEDALHRACAEADIVVLNAGSSKGSDDWAMEILDKIGHVINHEVSHGPGHHSSYAVVDNTPIVGISGPALGATFTTDFYLKPVIDLWYGRPTTPQHVTARLAAPFADLFSAPKEKDKRAGELRPAFERTTPFHSIRHIVLTQAEDGIIEATPLKFKPGVVQAETAAGYYPLANGCGHVSPQVGDMIEIELRG